MTNTKSGTSSRSPQKQKQRLRAVYARSRREFSAADLQKFTVEEEGIPLRKVIAEMEKIQRQHKQPKHPKR
jgi:hypothetical protein